jgi:hypothetical protein
MQFSEQFRSTANFPSLQYPAIAPGIRNHLLEVQRPNLYRMRIEAEAQPREYIYTRRSYKSLLSPEQALRYLVASIKVRRGELASQKGHSGCEHETG